MNVILNTIDLKAAKSLEEKRKLNFDILRLYSSYLNINSTLITTDLIKSITEECTCDAACAFCVILSTAFGLDEEKSKYDKILINEYIRPSVKMLDVEVYRNDPYYRNIRIPEIKKGKWELKYEKYLPYEGFVYDDMRIESDFTEIPRIGFFREEFTFPAVLENGVEWMTVSPNEVETLKTAISEAEGKVITFGLGLGYFAYMASEKENVNSITIVEKDKDVILLFKEYILPQFLHRDKVKIIHEDAFIYVEKQMSRENFDYALVDIWHDVSDGFELYLKMKKLEHFCPDTRFSYWIEDSLLSRLRWLVWDGIYHEINLENKKITASDEKTIRSFAEISEYLSNNALRKLAVDVKKIKG